MQVSNAITAFSKPLLLTSRVRGCVLTSLKRNSLKPFMTQRILGIRGNMKPREGYAGQDGQGKIQAPVMKRFQTLPSDIWDFCPWIATSFGFFWFFSLVENEKLTMDWKASATAGPFSTFVKGLWDYAVIYVRPEEYLLPLWVLISGFDWG